jgi:hypothetical protein
MTAPWWTLLLSAVVGGAAGGLVSGAFLAQRKDPHPTRAAGAAVAQEAPPPTAEDEHETLERLQRAEHRIALLTAALQKEERNELLAEDEDGATPTDGGSDATDVADPVFEAAVLDIIDREQERKEEERASWRRQLQVQRGSRYAAELTEPLQLSPEQQADVSQAVVEYFEKWRTLREDNSAERPATRNEWRATRDRMNQTFDEKLRTILRPDQAATYDALPADQKVGWRRERPQSDNAAR